MEVKKIKVSELKAALAEKGLDTKGNKAALIERLQAASSNTEVNIKNDDDNTNNDNNEIMKETNDEIKEENEAVKDENESNLNDDSSIEEVEGNNIVEENGSPEATAFEDQEFVSKKPSGISFELHDPTPVKPQPKELVPPEQNPDAEEISRRAGAAAYFAEQAAAVDPDTGEAVVPLPPSTGYGLEESEDDDDEGPPGTGSVELPSVLTQVKVSCIIPVL